MGTKANPYLKMKVFTASREELQMMLYEGAIRFCRQAKQKINDGDFESSYHLIHRAEQIVLELLRGLRPEVTPDVCAKLRGIYHFLYQRLFEANVTHDIAALDDCIRVFTVQKETWQELMNKLDADPEARKFLDATAPKPAASA